MLDPAILAEVQTSKMAEESPLGHPARIHPIPNASATRLKNANKEMT